jgi:ribonuclease G
LDYLTGVLKVKKFSLHVHPFIAAYLKRGFFFCSKIWQWKLRYGFGMRLIPDQSMELLQYRVFDEDKQEIDLKETKDAHV